MDIEKIGLSLVCIAFGAFLRWAYCKVLEYRKKPKVYQDRHWIRSVMGIFN